MRSRSEIRADEDSSAPGPREFQPLGRVQWSRIAHCPECDSLAFELRFYDPAMAQIPESQRVACWLSADGQRLAVPGRRDAPMPERYVAAGYRKIEAHSMRDLERFSEIRAAQTGNTVYSEMTYSASDREWRQNAELDSDSDRAETTDI